MSYCRTSDDSDVYVYASGKGIQCHVAWRDAVLKNVQESFFAEYGEGHAVAEKAMLGHLLYLRQRGLKVPEHATERLIREIAQSDQGSSKTMKDLEDDDAAWDKMIEEWGGLK